MNLPSKNRVTRWIDWLTDTIELDSDGDEAGKDLLDYVEYINLSQELFEEDLFESANLPAPQSRAWGVREVGDTK